MSPGRRRSFCAAHCVLRSAGSQLTWSPFVALITAIIDDLCLDMARSLAAYHPQLVGSFGAIDRCLLRHRGGTYVSTLCFDEWLTVSPTRLHLRCLTLF